MATGLSQQGTFGPERAPRWWRSLRSVFGRLVAPPSPVVDRAARLGDVCAVLDGARTLIERGWVQDRWLVIPAPAAHRSTAPGAHRSTAVHRSTAAEVPPDVSGACLVGAVVHAAQRHYATADAIHAAPALDVLWDAWQETRGFGGPGIAGPAAPREVRAARVRDLTRWNDQPDRTRDEVLGLIDLATSRAIMEAMGEPARR
jgi:hypothetical protein